MVKTLLLRIEGRVQGVGYRAWAVREARGLGLSGWVRNRFDGSVEALISGAEEAADRFVSAAHQGPGAAAVASVTVSPADDEDVPASFTERATI